MADDPASVAGENCVGNLPERAAQYEVTLAPPSGGGGNVFYVAFSLMVANGVPAGEGVLQAPIKEAVVFEIVPATCAYSWFRPVGTEWCPRTPVMTYPAAVGQRFENGLAIYVPARGAMPNRLLVLYTDGRSTGAMGFPVEVPPADLEVPAGRLAPAPQFYVLWERGSSNSSLGPLRDSLGWASGGPVTYTYEEQCAESPPGTPDYCYLTGPDGTLYVEDPLQRGWRYP